MERKIRLKIPKPKDEEGFVNLYNDMAEAISAIDREFNDYMLEPNIMDDKEFDEIAEFLNLYYGEVRGMSLRVVSENDEAWEIEIK